MKWRKHMSRCRYRVLMLYIITVVLIACLVDVGRVQRIAVMASLSRIMPYLSYFVTTAQNDRPFDADLLDRYAFYYKQVTIFMPKYPAGHALYGYCAYKMGNKKDARQAFRKAYQLNSSFMPFDYNYAVLLFEQGRFADAIEILAPALTTSLTLQIHYLSQSPVYIPLLMDIGGDDLKENLFERLKETHYLGYRLLMRGYDQTRHYGPMLGKAVEAINSGLDREGEFYLFAGYASLQQKEYEQAVYFLRESIRRETYHDAVLPLMAEALEQTGKKEMAAMVRQEMVQQPGARTINDILSGENVTVRLY